MCELDALSALAHCPSLSKEAIRQKIIANGSSASALAELRADPGLKPTSADYLQNWQMRKEWQQDLDSAERQKVDILPFWDELYPAPLKELPDAPLLLYVKGKWKPDDARAAAIVGTRQCTLYGKEMAERFGEDLARTGVTVVSGLARGIDTAAHIGALRSGRTIAVIGSGLGAIYPKENLWLAAKIAEQGAVISEYPMAKSPAKHHFPQRNRLVCALSLGALLIEAPLQSGAMITMRLAKNQNKFCFTLPGRIDWETFKGNHSLLKSQKAVLVENADEMLSILLGHQFPIAKNAQPELFGLEDVEINLLKIFPASEISLEELSLHSKLPIAKLSSLLMGLVLKQKVREFPGKLYKKA